jgi:membrane fusion protein, multidrug efflux system
MEPHAERSGPRSRRTWIVRAGLVIVAALMIGGGVFWWRARPDHHPVATKPAPIPVTVSQAATRDVPIYLDGLGTVQAWNTVSIRTQIDGVLQTVNFTEGQQVKKGDVLAQIDPRPLKAALEQAVAKKAEDQAQLVSAQKDLARFQQLVKKDFATQQSVDQQQAKVDQLAATIQADQAAIDAAQTQLSYTTITAPFDGRVGFRQVDAGNVVHASDPTPLTVLTQIRPSAVTFTLPQKNLVDVREAMLAGVVSVLAFDQDNTKQLAQGELLLVDNQIDQTTSSIRLKARFANEDDRLWPGEFVRLRTLVTTKKGVVTIPVPALQRGPQGLYAWVIKQDNTAELRPIEAQLINNSDVIVVTKGLRADERVVVNGQYRLQAGASVDAKTEQAVNGPDSAS